MQDDIRQSGWGGDRVLREPVRRLSCRNASAGMPGGVVTDQRDHCGDLLRRQQTKPLEDLNDLALEQADTTEDREDSIGLCELLTIYGDGKINLNTATSEVLEALPFLAGSHDRGDSLQATARGPEVQFRGGRRDQQCLWRDGQDRSASDRHISPRALSTSSQEPTGETHLPFASIRPSSKEMGRRYGFYTGSGSCPVAAAIQEIDETRRIPGFMD